MRYIVTGAAGHLGNTIVKRLIEQGESVFCLVLPGEAGKADIPSAAAVFTGNVLNPDTLRPIFGQASGDDFIVIHCAGIISIASRAKKLVYDVNVGGTDNILAMCREYRATRLIYISSVHAIPELPEGQLITETKDFSPDKVRGGYAKTKATATGNVLRAAADWLDACVVHPSGICGPGDYGRGNITQMIIDFSRRHLTAGLGRGGYDFVDVRDVADGVISACRHGLRGETYILSNRYYSIRELLDTMHRVTEQKPVRTFLPIWFAKLTAPLAELYYAILRQPPLYTPYSLYTLTSNSNFSHAKADAALGYTCRPIEQTLRDAYDWLINHGRIPKKA